jgi:hypothetical protein
MLFKNGQIPSASQNLQKAQELLQNEAVKKDAKEELAKLDKLLDELKTK